MLRHRALKFLLFDIDGTLLKTGGAGQVAMRQVMLRQHGLYEESQLDVHGRTDWAIIDQLLRAHRIEPNSAAIREFYDGYVDELESAMHAVNGTLLAGVQELLSVLHQMNDVHCGVLTGNGRAAAAIKLRHFGIETFFQFGGFGETTGSRNEIARIALQAARTSAPGDRDPDDVWVVGDTVHDVRCARSIGAKALAVGTGGVDLDELRRCGPDVFLPDLACKDTFLDSINQFPKLAR